MKQIKFSVDKNVAHALEQEQGKRGGPLAPLLREIFMIGFVAWKTRQMNSQAIAEKLQLLETLEKQQ